jgi:hypothetical protein
MKKSELKQLIKEEISKTLNENDDFTKSYRMYKDDVDEIWYKMSMKQITEDEARLAILNLFSKHMK